MEKYYDILKKCPLFSDIAESDLESLLKCLGAREQKIRKGDFVFYAGDKPLYVGIVLKGSVHILQEDYWGSRAILAAISPGGIFGEAFSCSDAQALPVSVEARDDGAVLLVDCKKILTVCSSACTFHSGLVRNLLKILANKNIYLTRKIEHITKKTTKEKVLSYLSEVAVSAGSNSFDIPFNRQELADYLSVERSALSGTLSKMKEENLIDFHMKHFTLY